MNKELLLCRLCLEKDALVNIFECTDTANMIKRCCPVIEIMENDQLPQGICTECNNTLGICDNFLTKCIESDRSLREAQNGYLSYIKIEEIDADDQYETNDQYFLDTNNPFKDVLLDVINTQTDNGNLDKRKDSENPNKKVIKASAKKNTVKRRNKPNTAKKVPKDGCKKLKVSESKVVLESCKTSEDVSKCVKKYPCISCDKSFASLCYLRRHIQGIHSGKRKVECKICNKTCENRDAFLSHLKEEHVKPQSYKCLACGVVLKKKLDWLTHNRRLLKNGTCLNKVFESDVFICDICNKTCHDKNDLKKHILCGHRMRPNVVCDICGKSIRVSDVSRHRATHTDERRFTCDICSKTLKNRESLFKHILNHQAESVVCEVCKKTYKSKRNLASHMKEVHSVPTKMYQCNVCDKTCKTKRCLLSHIIVHTQERRYQCRYCESKFSHARYRLEHERLHLGITPYKCPSCPKAFTQLGNMKSHFRHNHKDIDFSQVYKPRQKQ